MVKMVLQKIEKQRSIKTNIGRQILNIITSGMYNDPLMILREYIQNATDSIDEAISTNKLVSQDAKIDISVSGQKREITVIDNGTGISHNNVEERLGSIGFSHKEGLHRRGFRGIGRLGGLGYCDLLTFETRTSCHEPVSVVEWNGEKLEEISESHNKKELSDAIKSIATIHNRKAQEHEPSRFFKVTLTGIRRFHSDVLMDLKKIRTYLSQIAPVPYDKDFSYHKHLDTFFSKIPNYRTYSIFVNGEKLVKPYQNMVNISSNITDYIKDIKELMFTSPDSGDVIGLGWFAITSFKSSLPKSVTMRGIRVRHGNIEVGDERFLENIYNEKRFATWHIGEIHLNHNIKPNARRDGFEASYDYERFLEQIISVGKGLSKLCRDSSVNRSVIQKAITGINQAEKVVDSAKIILDENHKKMLMNTINSKMLIASDLASQQKLDISIIERLNKLKKKVNNISSHDSLINKIDKRKIACFSKKELIKNLCAKIIESYEKDESIETIIEKALMPYLKIK
jgi:molecular chaperone HtpG